MRRLGVTPHVAQNTARSGGSAIDGRTTQHEGYSTSIHARRGTVQWAALVPIARHRIGGRCLWPARDRRQLDPFGQPA